MRSDTITCGVERSPARALLYATGLTKENMGKPFIGIASSFTDLIPGHTHMRQLERDIEKGKGGLKYNYYSKVSKEELANRLSKKFVGFLKRTFGEASIAYLKKNI